MNPEMIGVTTVGTTGAYQKKDPRKLKDITTTTTEEAMRCRGMIRTKSRTITTKTEVTEETTIQERGLPPTETTIGETEKVPIKIGEKWRLPIEETKKHPTEKTEKHPIEETGNRRTEEAGGTMTGNSPTEGTETEEAAAGITTETTHLWPRLTTTKIVVI